MIDAALDTTPETVPQALQRLAQRLMDTANELMDLIDDLPAIHESRTFGIAASLKIRASMLLDMAIALGEDSQLAEELIEAAKETS